MQIVIVYGGTSAERAVSLRSGARVYEALRARHRVTLLDYCGRLTRKALRQMREADAVFLALHGGDGEGGALQRTLEEAGIFHYTGTASEGAAVAMHKANAKARVASAHVPVASGVIWRPQEPRPALPPLPVAIKPLSGGSSIGLRIIKNEGMLRRYQPTEPMLCEAYLSGREYTVGVLNGIALPVVEILPRSGTYDYISKYTAGATEELCPAPITRQKRMLLENYATRAFTALSLRDFARIDFKEDSDGMPVFLEANTLPGLTETSLLPLAAAAAGMDFFSLCMRMVQMAAKRRRGT